MTRLTRSPILGPLLSFLLAAALVTAFVLAGPGAALAQQKQGDLGPPDVIIEAPDVGVFSLGSYDIGCSNGGVFGNFDCMAFGTLTNMLFLLGRSIVGGGMWILKTAVGFGVEESLVDAATSIANALDTQILGPVGLGTLGLMAVAVYMGWKFLRGQVSRGAGELVVSLIVAGVLGYVATGPGYGGVVVGGVNGAANIAGAMVVLSTDSTDPDSAADAINMGLTQALVRDPYDTINWGYPLAGTPCAVARNQILGAAEAPWGREDTPRDVMDAAGCTDEADFNKEASGARAFAAFMYVGMALTSLVLLAAVAMSIIVAKGLSLFLIALLPVALYAGIFPGAGRHLLWRWVGALIRIMAVLVALGIFLALLISGLNALLGLDRSLFERFALILFFTVIMWFGRKQLMEAANGLATSVTSSLESAQIGGSHTAAWLRPYQTGGVTALGAASTAKEGLWDVPGYGYGRQVYQDRRYTRRKLRTERNVQGITRSQQRHRRRPSRLRGGGGGTDA